MAITRLTPAYGATGSAAAGAQSLTDVEIPAGATCAIIHFAFWRFAAGSISSVSLDGQSATQIVIANADTGVNFSALFFVSGFSAGTNKTLAWTNSATWEAGTGIEIEFRSGVDISAGTTSAIRDSDGAQTDAEGGTASVTLTAQAGDEIISGVATDSGASGYGSGQTQLQSAARNGLTSAITSETATGNDTQSVTGDFPVIVSAVLIPAAGGGGGTVQADLTEGGEFGSTFAAVATARGALTAAVAAGASNVGRAAAIASMSAAIGAGDASTRLLASAQDIAAAAEADEAMTAIASAAAALSAGAAAGEAWASQAQAAASLAAGGSFGDEFASAVSSATQGTLRADTEASDAFTAAVSAIAALTAAASFAEALDATASAIGAFTAAALFGAVFTSSIAGETTPTPRSRQMLVRHVERVALQSKTDRSLLIRRRNRIH